MTEHHVTVRATSIIGTHVENWEGEKLGLIEDVMVDKRTGTVTYLVLVYPGEYGRLYPNKRFAVPFTAIAMRDTVTDVDYILNVDETFLQNAPGFDCENRPDFADQRFTDDIQAYYKDVSVDIRV